VTRIVIETRIRAPREQVFDLARSVDAHVASSSFTRERAVPPGRTSGLLEAGDTVTFEGVHFGVRQRFTARIVSMTFPSQFVDEAVHGAFASMRHTHEFFETPDGTLMRDTLDWRAPLGILGRIADALVLRRHLTRFVTRKQMALKEMAEAAMPPRS
jgi:ligand-binding SRPBCC domain-containing protein